MGRRTGAVLVSLLLLLTLAVSASAAAVKMTVGVRFCRVAVVKGLSSGKPELAGLYSALGEPVRE